MQIKITVKSKEQFIQESNIRYTNELFKMIPLLKEYTGKTLDGYLLEDGDVMVSNKGFVLTKDEYYVA